VPVLAYVHHLREPFLGHAGVALREAGADLLEVDRRRGDPLPALDAVDGIVSAGGEQSAVDLRADPVLAEEADWLREAATREVPVLGVCLGGQLLAAALGGTVAPLSRRLVHWLPLEVTDPADPLFGALPAGAHGLYWNEDGFEPPPGAVELVRRTTPSCSAFRRGRAWGVQFHPDADAGVLDHWYRGWSHAPGAAGTDEASARAADARHLGEQAAVARALFGSFARLSA